MKEKLQIRFASHTYTPKIVSTVNCQKKLALFVTRLFDPYNQQCYLLLKGRVFRLNPSNRKAMFAKGVKGHTLVVRPRNRIMDNYYSDESFYKTPLLKKWLVDQKGNKEQAENRKLIQNELRRRNQ